MFIKKENVLKAIENLNELVHTSKVANEKKALSIYLLLKKIGLNKFESVSKKTLKDKKEEILEVLYELGGIFDKNETGELKSCLFFSNFSSCSNAETPSKKQTEFYNKGTKFKDLPGRVIDTIDNSIVDTLLRSEKNESGENFYLLINKVEEFVSKQYTFKPNFLDVVTWIYRFHEFENKIDLKDLKKMFLNEFNLNETEFFNLFRFTGNSPLNFEDTSITGKEIREKLELDFAEIKNEKSNFSFLETDKFTINATKLKNITGGGCPLIDKDYLKKLLEKHKQVILTGVPGTGKSYFTQELEDEYNVLRLQFHPNYTYQDFVLGKTIKDNNLEYEVGFLLTAITKANENKGEKFLLVIDEINRGDISSIFGELIYLLDRNGKIKISNLSTKQSEDLKINPEGISIPENLFIIGTMNSSDRSIALIDYAIRRRFIFVELEPDYSLIDELSSLDGKKVLGLFLQKINENIVLVLEDRDLRLGHSIFINDESTNYSTEEIYDIIHFKIIPTIREYTYGHDEKLYEIIPRTITETTFEKLLSPIEEFIKI